MKTLDITLTIAARLIASLAIAVAIWFVVRYEYYFELVRLGAINIYFYFGMIVAVAALMFATLAGTKSPRLARVLYILTIGIALATRSYSFSEDKFSFYAIAMLAISLIGLLILEIRRATADASRSEV